MNKKFLSVIVHGALPFLLDWFACLLTAFSFNPREVFQSGSFWGPSMLYWVMWVCTIGLQVEVLNDIYDEKPAK